MTATRMGTWGSAAGSAAVAVGPLGHRIGLLPLGLGLALFAVGFLVLVAAMLLLVVTAMRRRVAPGTERPTYAALAAAVVVSLFPLSALVAGVGAPPIHDITTDTENPPAFVAAVALNAPGRTDYEGDAVAEQQRAAYPDLRPVTLPADTDTAFRNALAAVERMGWELLESDPAGLRIEATDHTFWFGFADDVVIRITDIGEGGSRVNIRSLSRVGGGDLGTNAHRVRAYLTALTDE